MKIEILCETYDKVLNSKYVVAKISIIDAFSYLVPIINRFKEQRYTLKSKVYEKLKIDVENGCIMPPLTIAFKNTSSIGDIKKFIINHISEAFVLDGIQRLNTIKKIFSEKPDIEIDSPVFLNILISDSMDKLLYRMVTLNNGQKPMSTRHQIEILASSLYDFDSLPIVIQSEKEQKTLGKESLSFSKENIIKAYIAFISNSYMLDNQKIIDEKMDELITNKIIDADLPTRTIEFIDVINLLTRLTTSQSLYKWFNNTNNMIGFCSAICKSYNNLVNIEVEDLQHFCDKVDTAISSINRSKINVGSFRRKSVNYIFVNFTRFYDASIDEILYDISEL